MLTQWPQNRPQPSDLPMMYPLVDRFRFIHIAAVHSLFTFPSTFSNIIEFPMLFASCI